MWRNTTIPPNLSAINANISSVAQQTATNASQLAALIGQNNAAGSGGISVSENFTQYTTNTLSAQWTVQPGATGFGVYIPSGSSFDNSHGVNTNIAWFTAQSSSNTRYYAQHQTVMKTDSASIQGVMGTLGQSNAFTTLFFHASANMDSFGYINIFDNFLYVGHGTFSAGTYTFNDFGSIGYTVANGDTVEIRNNGTLWKIFVNGGTVPVLNFTDSSGTIGYDANHRGWGYIIACNAPLFGTPLNDVSFGLQSITASDIAVPATLGTGWKQHRSSTSAISMPGSGNQLLSAGTLDTVDIMANVTSVDTAGIGGIQIQKTGWYLLTFRWETNGIVGGIGNPVFRSIVWTRNAQLTDPLVLRAIGGDWSGNAASAVININDYFTAGNIIYPGAVYTGGTPSVVGDVPGTLTYWEGMLSNA